MKVYAKGTAPCSCYVNAFLGMETGPLIGTAVVAGEVEWWFDRTAAAGDSHAFSPKLPYFTVQQYQSTTSTLT